ncbi:MAG: hypothetical protein K9G49_15490 [Taibaiella sp.]|nr:hypothetical protein [Taibaiella sp.]
MNQEEKVNDPAADNSAEKDNQSEHQHHGILEIIDEAISQLNTDFPLSGAETEDDFSTDGDLGEKIVSKEHLADNFPLSGGAVSE